MLIKQRKRNAEWVHRADRIAVGLALREKRIKRQQRYICEQVSMGRSMLTICTTIRGMPKYVTALEWLRDYPDFEQAYKRAQLARGDVLFEEALIVADDARNDWMASNDPNNAGYRLMGENIARSKLRVETRRWAASKLNPSRYADKVAVDATQDKPLVVAVTHKLVQVVRQETLPLIEHDEDEDNPR